ncbi:hypothetical protein JY97_15975 [Alkalispirochaeta odontotermitis]|nr:hypothetical protein JY97_15975 [Alkalispirochaeta odontotermitis]CAB1084270.1 hypothetical protein D1AOALGA4SA_11796 [Olavius algarvensis Delta 1 endosymbiont]
MVTYNNLTAEIAEHAEVVFVMTRSQDILLVFMAQPVYYLFFSALSALRGEQIKDPENVSIIVNTCTKYKQSRIQNWTFEVGGSMFDV